MIFSMYDWNHNGKHDAFDDAMFMALLEDDLEKNPPYKRHKQHTSDDGTWGCAIAIGLIIIGFISLVSILIGM